MKTYHQQSGLSQGLDFMIPTDWTPAQAWAVVELLDDLRERIYAHYLLVIQEPLREERSVDDLADYKTISRWDDSEELF
jgi:hypothetical protein